MSYIRRETVMAALCHHIGRARGITARRLVQEITGDLFAGPLAERVLRKVVSALREDGVAVCAHPSAGYFIAETPEELDWCCKYLRRRALHSLRKESRLRKIPLPELLGQLLLPT